MRANEKRRPGRGGVGKSLFSQQLAMCVAMGKPLTAITPVIVIDEEAFGQGFDVSVTPAQPVGHDRECRTHADAVRYAARLSQATGWRVIDRSEGASG